MTKKEIGIRVLAVCVNPLHLAFNIVKGAVFGVIKTYNENLEMMKKL